MSHNILSVTVSNELTQCTLSIYNHFLGVTHAIVSFLEKYLSEAQLRPHVLKCRRFFGESNVAFVIAPCNHSDPITLLEQPFTFEMSYFNLIGLS